MGTGDILLGVTLQWTSIPSRGGVAILSVASCYRNWDKLRPCGSPWHLCNFTFTLSDYLNACPLCGQTADRNSSLCKFETLTAFYFVYLNLRTLALTQVHLDYTEIQHCELMQGCHFFAFLPTSTSQCKRLTVSCPLQSSPVLHV